MFDLFREEEYTLYTLYINEDYIDSDYNLNDVLDWAHEVLTNEETKHGDRVTVIDSEGTIHFEACRR